MEGQPKPEPEPEPETNPQDLDMPRADRSGDPVRRVVWALLALYLAPALLIVLVVGGVAMGFLLLVRVLDRIVRGPSRPDRSRVSLPRPHIGIAPGMVRRAGR
ncbi:hypothetical protein BH23PLA1_BH23PLA1_00490 [soil metagenome]